MIRRVRPCRLLPLPAPPALRALPALACLVAGLAAPAGAAAQTAVRGVVLSEGQGSPVAAAVVELVDSAGVIVASGLTGPQGAFSLRSPGPGVYRLAVGTLGYRTVRTTPFVVAADPVLDRVVRIPLEPIRLDGIEVVGGGRCRGMGGAELVEVWEEARKALAAVVLADAAPGVSFRIALRERVLEPEWGAVIDEQVRGRQTWRAEPFRTAPAHELVRDGFIRTYPDSTVYYGPDARLLLSDAFLDAYCFGLAGGGDRIGLTFQPSAPSRGHSQITGTLWLDRATGLLRRLEFAYTNPPLRGGRVEASGEVEYERLPMGAWIVRSWVLRMPRHVTEDGRPSHLVGTQESSGHVVEVLGLAHAPAAPAPAGAVRGRVLATATNAPLGNVLVYLNGTSHVDTTSADGWFDLLDIAPGRYHLAWYHPELIRGDAALPSLPIELLAGGDTTVVLRVDLPPALAAGCATADGGAVWGRVTERSTHTPLPGAVVELRGPTGSMGSVRTDTEGAYRFCGLGPGRYRVAARYLEAAPVMEEVNLVATAAPRLNLAVALAAPGQARGRIVGRVVDADTGEPLRGAALRVPDMPRGRSYLSNDAGGFAIPDVKPGDVRLHASLLGFGEAESSVEVAPGQTVQVEVRLGTTPIDLDPIIVTATSADLRVGRLADFRYRSQRGWGTFIMQEEIERRVMTRLTTLIAEHGFEVTGSPARTGNILNRRYACAPAIYVDGVLVTHDFDSDADFPIDMIHPLDVAGIEIYRGPAQVPAEFAGSNARCGVIAIWTRGSR
jgi:hypothetical protein